MHELVCALIGHVADGRPRAEPCEDDRLALVAADAPKPLLVQRESGADRTGLASALYKLSQGATLFEARRELSVRFQALSLAGAALRSNGQRPGLVRGFAWRAGSGHAQALRNSRPGCRAPGRGPISGVPHAQLSVGP